MELSDIKEDDLIRVTDSRFPNTRYVCKVAVVHGPDDPLPGISGKFCIETFSTGKKGAPWITALGRFNNKHCTYTKV